MNCAGDHAHAPMSVIKHCFEISAFWEASVRDIIEFNKKVSQNFKKVENEAKYLEEKV
jgi:hypothetical protein